MQYLNAILQSDGVNLYKELTPTELLIDGVRQTFKEGLPQCFVHDMHQPIGWVYPMGVYFKPHQALLRGVSMMGDTPEDFQQLRVMHQNRLAKDQDRLTKNHHPKLKNILKDILNDTHQPFHSGCSGVIQDGLVNLAIPEFSLQIDDDGLVPMAYILENFIYLGRGVFAQKDGDLTIHAHQFFRRSLSRWNAYHYLLIDSLVENCGILGTSTKLRIDPDFIGHKESFTFTRELDYWYGPKFSDDIKSIPTGHCVHASDDHEKRFSRVLKTDFYWEERDGNHVFECEEIADSPTLGISLDDYGCRYIHTIHDDKEAKIFHFDGSIRLYTTEEMLERQVGHVHSSGRSARYTKLFRVDGLQDVSQWKMQCVLFLQGNYQVKPYFGLEEVPITTQPHLEIPEKVYAPILPTNEDGPRFYVTVHSDIPEGAVGLSLINFDRFLIGEDKFKCIEAGTIEVIKQFRNSGTEIPIPEETLRVDHRDEYLNIPTIFHPVGKDAKEDVNRSAHIVSLALARIARGKIRHVSLSLSWPFEGARVQLAIAGSIELVKEWLDSKMDAATSWSELREYAPVISEWLRNKGGKKEFNEMKFGCRDGALYFYRPAVNHKVKLKEESGKIVAYASPEYMSRLRESGLQVIGSKIIEASSCSICHADYKRCPHLMGDLNSTAQEVVEGFSFGPFIETRTYGDEA